MAVASRTLYTLVVAVVVLFLCKLVRPDQEVFPAPHGPNNRLMGFILAYNFDHIDPLMIIVNEYLSMCEAGWRPTMVLFSTSFWDQSLQNYLKYKLYCYDWGQSIPVRFSIHPPQISIGLGAVHRKVLAEELNNFDVFVYHEDDIVFKYAHLMAYLHETRKLKALVPDKAYHDFLIGFQRYRKLFRTGKINQGEYSDHDAVEQDLLEEVPTFNMHCIHDQPYIHVTGNKHQAVWVLTREQVNVLQDKCQFLNQSSPSREFMSSFSLFDGPYCNLAKILPPTGVTKFGILHYYQQRHVSWDPFFLADWNTRAGYNAIASPRQDSFEMAPDCWKPLIEQYRHFEEETVELPGTTQLSAAYFLGSSNTTSASTSIGIQTRRLRERQR
jgi:hypothetical protein